MPAKQSSEADLLPDDALWVLQVSDTHLYQDQNTTLAGVNTFDAMQRTVTMALRNTPRKPDLIIATGDLVHDASSAGYHRLAHWLLELEIPAYYLPGNHDDPRMMVECMSAGNVSSSRIVETDCWRILLLDSTIAGQEGGHLNANELAWLEQLIQSTDKHLLVCLHHQPIPVGSHWIDTMAVDNGCEFVSMIKDYEQVKGVIWGHVHQAFEQFQNNVHWLSAPSTCIQFTPGVVDFAVDPIPPGCRLLALSQNGEINSRILRLDELPKETMQDIAGYS